MLIALDAQGQRVAAIQADKSQSYVCPSCAQAVRLRAGSVRVHHFAHLAENPTCPDHNETIDHLESKQQLHDALSKRYSCQLELPIMGAKDISGQIRRIDLAIKNKQGRSIAIEVQHSPIDLALINNRNAIDQAHGFARTLWVFTARRLKFPRTDTEHRMPAEAIRLYRRQGAIWCYDPDEARLDRITWKPVERYVEPNDFYEGGFRTLKSTFQIRAIPVDPALLTWNSYNRKLGWWTDLVLSTAH